MFKSLKDTLLFCQENLIKMVDFMMIDINGRWRHLTMPLARLSEDTLINGIGFDGSNYGFAPVEKSDMVFIPDLSTAFVDPFSDIPTLAMIGDVFVIDITSNSRFDQYPRNVAFNAESALRSSGFADEFRIGPEFEFHVFDHVSYSVFPNSSSFSIDAEQAEWNSGLPSNNLAYKMPNKGGYHMAPPLDKLSGFRSRAVLLLEQLGIPVKYHHHEVGGPGQLEIEVEFGSLLNMADKTMLTKYIIKNLAASEKKTATFMPKPIFAEAGNGMHVHMHLFKNGLPIFFDPNGYSQLSDAALFFIGGILSHAPALCAFTNPSTNSYKRLIPGFEAPVTIGYATSNRSAVIRIPAYAKDPDKKRFELRSPDATCNPYYAFSAILMAGVDGLINKINPASSGFGPFDFNLYNLSPDELSKISSLPRSLDEALDALSRDHDFLLRDDVFPLPLIDLWISNKRRDAARYNQLPHPVEFDMYFDI